MSSPDDDPELIEPRPDERLDVTRLEPYLRERLPRAEGPLGVRQFAGGHANLTYLLRFGEDEYVLRRPPLGPIAPGSHDMRREFRVLSKLYRVFPLAPRCFLHCDDDAIIGAEFQVMERRHGTVIRKQPPARLANDRATGRRIGEMMADVLAELHLCDRDAAGLSDLGRPDGFVARQVGGWTKRWHAAVDEDDARMSSLISWLSGRIPTSGPTALVHNDYKLDNILVAHEDLATPVAVLDWDMCTSGDALMDLGYLLNQWPEPDDDPAWIEVGAIPLLPGLPSRAEVTARYAASTGFDVSRIRWYYAFAAMKFAVVIQQIYIRFVRGQTRDQRFARYDARRDAFIDKGCEIAEL
ncbi:MAG: phosphotransferase family protein [Gammaproteobacteria bacterium]|nr:phosphotransferase family protein [Gammaproteobacteria bacterium]